MAANKYAGTQTEKNLQNAFAGESQARNKYTYFASVAKKEGYEQKVRITNGQICKKALPKRLKRKAFQSLQQNSGLQEKLRSITKRDIVHFLRILKLHRSLRRVKLRYGNDVTADILQQELRLRRYARYVIILRVILKYMQRIIKGGDYYEEANY